MPPQINKLRPPPSVSTTRKGVALVASLACITIGALLATSQSLMQRETPKPRALGLRVPLPETASAASTGSAGASGFRRAVGPAEAATPSAALAVLPPRWLPQSASLAPPRASLSPPSGGYRGWSPPPLAETHVWRQGGRRFLLAVCLRGQLHNRLGCLYRHLVLASLLNRTLVARLLPPAVPLDLCSLGPVSRGRPCMRYRLPLAWDLRRTQRLLGPHAVLSTQQAARLLGRPLLVRHLHCWHGPQGVCAPKWRPRPIIGKNCLGTAVVRRRRRLPHSVRPVEGGEGEGAEAAEAGGRRQSNASAAEPQAAAAPVWQAVAWEQPGEEQRLQLLQEDGAVAVHAGAAVRFACLPRFARLQQVLAAFGGLQEEVLAVGDLVGTAIRDLWPADAALVGALLGPTGLHSGGQQGGEEGPQRGERSPCGRCAEAAAGLPLSAAAQCRLESLRRNYSNALLGSLEDWTTQLAPLSTQYPAAPIAPHPWVQVRAMAAVSLAFGSESDAEEGAAKRGARRRMKRSTGSAFWKRVEKLAAEREADSRRAEAPCYLALHWRRGDWAEYCAVAGPPGACNYSPVQAAYCVAKVAQPLNVSNVFVATNAPRHEFQAFVSALGPAYSVLRLPRVPRKRAHPLLPRLDEEEEQDVADLVGLLIEKVIAANAVIFLRTPSSSFSKDILRLRLGIGRFSLGSQLPPHNSSAFLSAWIETAKLSIASPLQGALIDDILCNRQKEWEPLDGLTGHYRNVKLSRMKKESPAEWPL